MLGSSSSGSRVVLLVAAVAASLAFATSAAAQTGGSAPPPGAGPAPVYSPTGKATILPDGSAVPPAGAPPQVVAAIAAGNAIRLHPYIYGGGHKSFSSAGYDCSGAVSFVLHGAGILNRPLPSGPFMRWALPGPGAWITVFANKGHAYMTVAGLRFDTSGAGEALNSGSGPRWRATKRRPRGYVKRHWPGL